MPRWTLWGLAVLCACKAEVGGDIIAGDATPSDVAVVADASTIDVPTALGPWGTPQLVPGASSTIPEDDGTLSHSGLELVFAMEDANDAGRKHLFVMTRATATSTTWSAPVRLPFNVNGTTDQTPRFAENDLTLYFGSNRTGTTGGLDVWQTVRPSVGGAWGGPTLIPGVNSTATDKWFMPCDGGRYLLISSRAPSTTEDVYEGTLGGGAPTLVASLSSDGGETGSFLTKDCLTAYFASNRNGTNLIYTATRTTAGGPWPAPVIFDEFLAEVPGNQEDPWLAPDGRTFVFSSSSAGNKDVYLSTR